MNGSAGADPAALFASRLHDIRAGIAADAGLEWPPVSGELNEVPPVLMTLATVGPDGFPRTRTVMVSHADGDGRIWFHTDSRSEKARHIAGNPAVSLTVLSPDRSAQITVTGEAARAGAAEEERAYADRVRYLQLLAWLNDAALAHRPEDERHRIWAEFATAHPDLSSTPPDTWVGYAVTPREYLFWSADSDGPSRRRHYTRDGTGWGSEILPG